MTDRDDSTKYQKAKIVLRRGEPAVEVRVWMEWLRPCQPPREPPTRRR